MVEYPPGQGRRPIDPVVARALAEANAAEPELRFEKVSGAFVNNHQERIPVLVTRVTGFRGDFRALIFKTTLNEDLDGAPNTYAPPVGVVTPPPPPPGSKAPAPAPTLNLDPRPGLRPIETSIKNATNEKGVVFHIDPKQNTFNWTGVKHASGGARADVRNFLRDANGDFPLFNPAGSEFADFYAPQTAIDGADGQAVNPLETPYAALSTELKANGGVRLGDVGLAIRVSTGASTGFIYADSGGTTSTSVGECSRKMIRNLFGGPATNEDICYIVLRHTAAGPVADAALIPTVLRSQLETLQRFTSDSVDEFVARCANPQLGESLNVGRRFVPPAAYGMNLQERARNIDAIERANVRSAFRRWGAVGV